MLLSIMIIIKVVNIKKKLFKIDYFSVLLNVTTMTKTINVSDTDTFHYFSYSKYIKHCMCI